VAAILLGEIVSKRFGVPVTLAYSGVIGRAENAALLDYYGGPFRPLAKIKRSSFDAVALVDTQPGAGNHPFSKNHEKVVAVLDHHRLQDETRSVPFHDIYPSIGATTTLLYLYWAAAGFELNRKRATLLLYALRSETLDLGREATPVDREVYKEFYAEADLRALSSIVNAKVTRQYFAAVHKAIERAEVYGPAIITTLGELPYPDVVAQISDYFLKCQDASYAFSMGTYRGTVLLSLRAEDPDAHMGSIARSIVGEWGSAGGHGSAAGGQIPVREKTTKEIDGIQKGICKRLLSALGLGRRRGRPLLNAKG
jgi:nanoRNase/pAp phosphatase (c-di-AMP/oligoRNAs hydrolase)